MKQLFLPGDQLQADKELDCYGYCLDRAITLFAQGNFDEAAAYHENIARSLRELARMKKAKQQEDQLRELLKQAKDKKLLYRLQVNIYE